MGKERKGDERRKRGRKKEKINWAKKKSGSGEKIYFNDLF